MTRSTENPVAGDLRAKHTLVAPASPSAILAKAISDSGDSLDYVSAVAEIKPKRLRAILDGDSPTKREVRGLAVVLDRWWVALWAEVKAARAAVKEWQREDERLVRAGRIGTDETKGD